MLNILPALSFTSLLLSSFSLASQADSHLHSQYGMSLFDETVTMASGAVTHPMAAQGNQIMGTEEKAIVEVTDGVYHLAGWGLANSTAIEGPEGWIIIDTGDNIPAAREQRAYLEAKVGKIEVAAVLYTHSHYVWAAVSGRTRTPFSTAMKTWYPPCRGTRESACSRATL